MIVYSSSKVLPGNIHFVGVEFSNKSRVEEKMYESSTISNYEKRI